MQGVSEGDGRWTPSVGGYAVYPGRGVARIVELRTQEIAGQVTEFLVLRLLEDDSRILIPSGNVDRVGLREVVKIEDAKKIWEVLARRTRQRVSHGVTWSRQFRAYQDKVRSGSVFEVAEVLRDLMRLQSRKELSFGEHRLLESARGLIVGELAAVQASEATEIEREIKAVVR